MEIFQKTITANNWLCAWTLVSCLVTQSYPTLCHPMDCSPPGFSVYGILQARIQEWVAIPFSRGSSWSKDWTLVSSIAGGFFIVWVIREAQEYWEWVAYPVSKGSSRPRNWTRVSCIAGGFFTNWAMREPLQIASWQGVSTPKLSQSLL